MSKKLLFVFLIFISNLHASDMRWKTVEDIDLSESFMDEDNGWLFSVERFHLKNNEKFKVMDVTEYNYVISFYGNYDENGEEIIQVITVPK